MNWTPVHSAHAIERVRFEIHFSDSLPKKTMDALRREFSENSARLRFGPTQEQKTQNIIINDAVNQAPLINEAVGWQAVRTMGTPSLPAEAVILSPNLLVYESSEYRQWTVSMKRFFSVCGQLLGRIMEIVDLQSFSHDYTDRFVFRGPVERAAAALLLSESITHMIPKDAISGKELWHLHRGWFEDKKPGKLLINQNLDMQDGTTQDSTRVRSLQIYTKAEARGESCAVNFGAIEGLVSALHMVCNETFARVLSDEGRHMLRIDALGAGGHD